MCRHSPVSGGIVLASGVAHVDTSFLHCTAPDKPGRRGQSVHFWFLGRNLNAAPATVMSWRSYRHRLVPWLLANWKSRSVRRSKQSAEERSHIAVDIVNSLERQSRPAVHARCGFSLSVRNSSLPNAGRGVFLAEGNIRKGQLVALYPGIVYQSFQPIFVQSLGNPFILRCVDGVLVDGNRSRLSSLIFRSCWHRDRLGDHFLAESSWLTEYPLNPLSIGQLVNNQTHDVPANVSYEEANLLVSFPIEHRRYIPNLNFQPLIYAGLDNDSDVDGDVSTSKRVWVRVVGLVASRDIAAGEEILSSYMTLVSN